MQSTGEGLLEFHHHSQEPREKNAENAGLYIVLGILETTIANPAGINVTEETKAMSDLIAMPPLWYHTPCLLLSLHSAFLCLLYSATFEQQYLFVSHIDKDVCVPLLKPCQCLHITTLTQPFWQKQYTNKVGLYALHVLK